jgi:signal transduction histidine kinase/CheY-like chemotaxis protein
MTNDKLHSYFARQVKKYIDDELLAQKPSLHKFIEVINQSYLSYEKDAELVEKSIRLNDIEYKKINTKLKEELNRNTGIVTQLYDAIKQLDDVNSLKVDTESNSDDLFRVLKDEIEFKKKHEKELFEAKLVAEKANEAKSDFLSVMSHEIRTPLNAIIGLSYIMENQNDIESIQSNLELLKKSSQNLLHLVNNILDYNKIENGKIILDKTSFDYVDLVNDIIKSLEANARENNNTILLTVDPQFAPNVIGDPLRISQIITNLISNAIKFTKNGKIEVKISTLEKTKETILFQTEVIDSGIGIDLTKFSSIFEKFSQYDSSISRKYGGSGLGLVIVKNLLQLFQSKIEIASELGKGTNFHFLLEMPIFDKETLPANSHYNLSEIQNLEGMRILLVEDNVINIKVAERILQQWNIKVDIAQNGLLALEKFSRNRYDAILMDLSMPIMDGYEAIAKIRLLDTKIPIIALTASTSYLNLDKALQVGANSYVTKPFVPNELNYKLALYYNNPIPENL